MTRLKAFAALATLVAALGTHANTAHAHFFEFSSTVTISSVTSPIPNVLVNGAPGGGGGNSASVTDSVVGDQITLFGRNRATPPNGANHKDASFPPGTDITVMIINLSNLDDINATTFDFDYSLTLTVTNYPSLTANNVTNLPNGTGTQVINGHLHGTYSQSQQNTTVFTMVPQGGNIFVSGGQTYELFSLAFTPPTDIGAGTVTAHLNSPPSVPEPASMTLLGIGALGMFRMVRRRNKAMVNA